MKQRSGVPIESVVLLWSNSDPVAIRRTQFDYVTGNPTKSNEPSTIRLYDGQNNHHIEIRVDEKGNWRGEIVTAFEAANAKLARLRALKESGIPDFQKLRLLGPERRREFRSAIRKIEAEFPIVNRGPDKEGRAFVMSLSEGEMLYMPHKKTEEVSYFVVAKLDKPQSVVLVPHWDARSATERNDADGKKVPDSKREQFSVTPNDLKNLAPPGHPHAVKVRVSPLGKVTFPRTD